MGRTRVLQWDIPVTRVSAAGQGHGHVCLDIAVLEGIVFELVVFLSMLTLTSVLLSGIGRNFLVNEMQDE